MRHYLPAPLRFGLAALTLAIAAAVLGLCGAYQYLQPALPDVAAIRDIRLQVPLRVYSRDGKLIAQFGEQRRIPLSFEALPKQMVNAVLAAEDDRFFQHSGVDYPGLARAIVRHLISGEKGEGGSTITMQLTRGIFLSPEKSYRRKLQEIFLTLRIEQQFSKQEILALYMNKMFLGQRAYGVGAASEVYFGKTVDQLDLPQIALIAGTFRLPSRDNPVANPELAKHRRSYVLRRMREKNFITAEEQQAADASPVESKLHGPAVEVEAPYIAEMVRADLYNRLGTDAYTAGYEVVTTLDSRLQSSAVRSVRAALVEYDQRHGYRGPSGRVTVPAQSNETEWSKLLEDFPERGGLHPALIRSVEERSVVAWSRAHGRINLPWTGLSWARAPLPDGGVGPALQRASDVLSVGDIVYVAQERSGSWRMVQVPEAQGAFVAMDPQDGGISALVGGFDYFSSNFNRAVQAKRQPGSAFKPFLYSAALEHGFTPASVINDAPLVIEDPSLEAAWRPQNNTREFRGPMRLREALVRSRNLVSIRVMHALGPAYTTKYIERFGFPAESLPRNLTLALGTAQVSPLDMASAYSVFANGGYRVTPYYIDRILGPDGGTVYESQPRIVCRECVEPPPDPNEMINVSADAPAPATVDERSWGGLSYLPEKLIAPPSISPQNDFLMTDMMADVVRRGTAVRAMQLKRSDLAGKTGTTNDRRDAWFCGYNSQLVGAAWVGFDQERSLGPGEEGSRTALPMWIYFMNDALQGVPELRRPPPPGLVTMRISADSGLAARPGEPNAIFETFMAGHLPAEAQGEGNPGDGTSPSEQSSDEPIF
ncbi:penicillin-binding protein 1A [Povalibacter uvarum]|uniref:Penicillin-binding protein 1A n=1 Tax=Povalibacter uvarum TaxID=732238 RepID=A0A841HIZ4_9GAMM|nr:penicillin-binding protein 1A [Povalibacter uvarum]MBB6092987.1 penicillin-binding protein 1A [Povalibacter uvarum]